ncbi:MAG: hypothetical protein LBT09_14600 [Planctomycetaceae bacterium]|jgi:hypothetical protein|nr:hypothetical protein [Planctomycetaceae bacterium]
MAISKKIPPIYYQEKSFAGEQPLNFKQNPFAGGQPLNFKQNHLRVGNLSPKGCVGVLADREIGKRINEFICLLVILSV